MTLGNALHAAGIWSERSFCCMTRTGSCRTDPIRLRTAPSVSCWNNVHYPLLKQETDDPDLDCCSISYPVAECSLKSLHTIKWFKLFVSPYIIEVAIVFTSGIAWWLMTGLPPWILLLDLLHPTDFLVFLLPRSRRHFQYRRVHLHYLLLFHWSLILLCNHH